MCQFCQILPVFCPAVLPLCLAQLPQNNSAPYTMCRLFQSLKWDIKAGISVPIQRTWNAGFRTYFFLILIRSGSVTISVFVLRSDSWLLSYISAGPKPDLIPIVAATILDVSKPLVSNWVSGQFLFNSKVDIWSWTSGQPKFANNWSDFGGIGYSSGVGYFCSLVYISVIRDSENAKCWPSATKMVYDGTVNTAGCQVLSEKPN